MILVVGAGAWGSAIYDVIKEKEKCFITSRKKRDISGFIDLKEGLKKSKYVIIVITSQSIREFLKQVSLKDKKILIASKGIDNKELKFLNEVFEEYVDKNNLAFLSGPSFAKEVKEKKPKLL